MSTKISLNQNKTTQNTNGRGVRWGIDAIVELSDDEKLVVHRDEDTFDENDDVVFYKWDFKRLDLLFQNADHGRAFKNAIFSLWLKGVTEYIVGLDS